MHLRQLLLVSMTIGALLSSIDLRVAIAGEEESPAAPPTPPAPSQTPPASSQTPPASTGTPTGKEEGKPGGDFLRSLALGLECPIHKPLARIELILLR